MIFLGARGQDARALIPQLLFNRAGGLPIYATALIYDGKPSADINGLRFCDAPWIIGQSADLRSEEQTYELQSLMRISYAVFCLKKKKKINIKQDTTKII